MSEAYVVAEIRVTQPSGYADYVVESSASVAKYGGEFLVRGGPRQQFEGQDDRHSAEWRTVIVKFPSMQQARLWYHSVEYTKARAIRVAHSEGRLFLVEGVPVAPPAPGTAS